MKTISAVELEQVTGGKGSPSASIANTSGGGGDNDQILSTLQNIQSSLKDLGNKNNGGLFGGNNGLMFMTMALALSRRNDVVVQGGSCCRGRTSFSWRASW